MNSHGRDLTQGPIAKQLRQLAVPMVIGIMAIIVFNVVDTFYVAQLGVLELAALSFTFPVVMIIGSLTLGLGTGVTSVLARTIGEKHSSRVPQMATNSLALAVTIVTIVGVAGYMTIEPLFTLLGAQGETLEMIKQYMEIWYIGSPFLVIPMVGNAAIRSLGDTKTPAMIMILAAIFNAVIDPLLIFGLGPIPALGLEGAAWATVISRFLTLVASLGILHFREELLTNPFINPIKMFRTWKKILFVGIPAAGTNIIVPITTAIITKIVAEYGESAVAGLGVGSRIEALVLIPMMGVAASLGPFVGQNIGAKNISRIRSVLKTTFKFSAILTLIIIAILAPFGSFIVGLFNDEPLVLEFATTQLLIVPFGYFFICCFTMISSTFNAMGKAYKSTVLAGFRLIVLYVPMTLVLNSIYGYKGVFYSFVASSIIASIAAYIWIQRELRPVSE